MTNAIEKPHSHNFKAKATFVYSPDTGQHIEDWKTSLEKLADDLTYTENNGSTLGGLDSVEIFVTGIRKKKNL